jgi:hypothetical protein
MLLDHKAHQQGRQVKFDIEAQTQRRQKPLVVDTTDTEEKQLDNVEGRVREIVPHRLK